MDPAKHSSSGKLKKISLRNLRNNFGLRSHASAQEEEPKIQAEDVSPASPDSEVSFAGGRNRTLSIFKSLKKKCKGTLSNCKPKQKAHDARLQRNDCCSNSLVVACDVPSAVLATPARVPSLPTVVETPSTDPSPSPPPVPPRVPQPNVSAVHSNRGIQEELLALSRFGWYWGSISRAKVEEKLKDQPDGAFLVRDSSSDNYILSLSFRSAGRTFHTRIEHSFGCYTFYSQQQGFPSIAELVETSMALSEGAVLCYSAQRGDDMYPGYPVRLTKPVSRFTEVRSLTHLCRFVIRQYVSVNNIPKLPLPAPLKSYIQLDYW